MKPNKTIIFLGDGMADEPIDALGGKTPLQVASTPAMDSIARLGLNGTLRTLPEGFPTSSDVANMSVLGCDLSSEYCGRGPLEAVGRGIPLRPDDIVFRVNLTTVENNILTDFSGGHPSQDDANALINALNNALGSDCVRFYPGVSYRNLLVLSGASFSSAVYTEKPDDNQGNVVNDHLPQPTSASGSYTAAFLRKLMIEASAILETHPINRRARAHHQTPANGVWAWSGGQTAAIRTLHAKYGIRSAVISAVDVINGLGTCLGMDVIPVPGATGYIDTHYEGKADAALGALDAYDLIFLHVEAIDEVSHAQDLDLKIKTIEAFDGRVVGRVLDGIKGRGITTVVLPDHPVPIHSGKHTRTPVPVAIARPGWVADDVQTFDEIACENGRLGHLCNDELMNLLFK